MAGMDRRSFLKLAGMAGVTAAFGASGCAVAAPPAPSASPAPSTPSAIRYPHPLRRGDVIGITAPSAGVGEQLEPRLRFCVDSLRRLGYEPRLGRCLRSDRIVSAPAAERAAELTDMLLDDAVAAVLPPWGGELLIDIFPFLDFERLAKGTPKWIVGYSDLATFKLPYTLLTGIATMHGSDLLEAPIRPTAPSLAWWGDVVRLPAGASFAQQAADLYQSHDVDWEKDPTATSFDRTEPVAWKCLGHETDPAHTVTATGRLIGGTLDVIGMLPGTTYGDLEAFARSYAPEGLLFYLDNCDFNPAQYCRMLHHLRLAGWFGHANALLIGRTAAEDLREFTPRDALQDALGDLTIPVIYDMDIGHLPPQLILVNGAVATVGFSAAERSLAQRLV
jgi:muramoyltetrapeptide carboxypeptidase